MNHVRFGTTGLQVSRLCLGTMTFGLQCDEKVSSAILDTAAEGGITFLDTADVYPLGGKLEDTGRTEEIVGRWLKGKRERFVVATKCSGKTGPCTVAAGHVAQGHRAFGDRRVAQAPGHGLRRSLPAASFRCRHAA